MGVWGRMGRVGGVREYKSTNERLPLPPDSAPAVAHVPLAEKEPAVVTDGAKSEASCVR